MKKSQLLLPLPALLIALPGFAQLAAPSGPDNTPAVGAVAPDFAMPRGAAVERLSGFTGEKKVLLMFFPGAFTPGCTQEFTEAGRYHDQFVEMGVELVGISRDLAGALNAFKESVGAENLFVSDPAMEVIHAYGAEMANRGVAARYYFLIDEEGKIAWKNTTGQLIPTERLIEELRSL